MNRALAAAATFLDFGAITRIGELLLLMRQGFVVAASERGKTVYEEAECAEDLAELGQLLQQGRVRVRVEWLGQSVSAASE
jgi:hypothetical protein